ncbi:MAG: NAD(P)H-hydrate dehydratase [Candidatus Krumholzibacteriia bacterium]
MRVATAREMAAIDRGTIAAGVPGAELMERAGRGMTAAALALFPGLAPPAGVAICCGKGNNGGDGLVMARHFAQRGFAVSVLLLAPPDELTADARLNLDRLPPAVRVETGRPDRWAERWPALCDGAGLAVDAVFGTGVVPPIGPPHAALLAAFAAVRAPVLAVDIPSGVAGDSGQADPAAVRAAATVTVGLPKLGLLLPPGRDHVGRLEVIDIGFDAGRVRDGTADRHWLAPAEYAALLPPRRSDCHKYGCGTVLVVAGSRAYGGAAALAGLGALRSGAGLVTVAAPAPLETSLRFLLPEALLLPLPATPAGTAAPPDGELAARLLARCDAVAIGPGLGADPATDRWLVDFLGRLAQPAVVDADAFTAWGRLGTTPRTGGREVVVTPHAGELAAVLGVTAAEVGRRRLDLAPELAVRWGVTLLLKGSPALVATPDGALYLNPSGDDALAHGGTGDVLTGLIGGLLAQGLGAREAALLGAWLHGRAGAIAAAAGSRRSGLAREVAAALPAAYAELEGGAGRGPLAGAR